MTVTVQGWEWKFEGFGIAQTRLSQAWQLERFTRRLIRAIDMQLLRPPQIIRTEGIGKAWGPGISGAALISDSSVVLHTCEDMGQVFVDIFSCKPLNKEFLDIYVSKYFQPEHYRSQLLLRGAPSLWERIIRLGERIIRLVKERT